MKPGDILAYWTALGPEGWFRRDDATDRQIIEKFGAVHAEAAAGKLRDWRTAPETCLAYVILLDQFSRNMFRGDGRAFAQDAEALDTACQALAEGYDRAVDPKLAGFFHMPFMHSESILDQNRCVSLFHANSSPEGLKFAIIHRDIIARFGRFPHRNPALGRHTTPTEQAFLDGGGFSA